MKAWLQAKMTNPHLWEKQAGFQKDKTYCQHSWNKWMMTILYYQLLLFFHQLRFTRHSQSSTNTIKFILF